MILNLNELLSTEATGQPISLVELRIGGREEVCRLPDELSTLANEARIQVAEGVPARVVLEAVLLA